LVGKKFVLIEDVVSSGGAIVDAARMLRGDGLPVDLALCVIDRETGGKEALANVGIRLESLFKYRDVDAVA
jgi:orotate phosphoribosyltransferase